MITIERYWIPADYDLQAIDNIIFYRDDHIEYEECKEFIKLCIDVIQRDLISIHVIYDKQFIKPKYYTTLYCKNDDLTSVIDTILSYRQTNLHDLQHVDNTIISSGQIFSHYSHDLLWHIFHDNTPITPDLILENIFDHIKTMTTVQIDFSSMYNWFKNYMSSLPICTSVGYYYIYNDNQKKKYMVSSKPTCVTAKMQSIGKKHQLSKWFDGGTEMYIQCTPRDVYFVVPKQIGNQLFGDHYRIHNISQYSPDYDKSTIFNDVIDIHRTNNVYDAFSRKYYSKHDPKCVFHNGTNAPIIDNDIHLDNLTCFNKRQTGYHYLGKAFTDKSEYKLISELIKMPFQHELHVKKSAANRIKKAIKKHIPQKAGSRKKYMNIPYDENLEYIHLIYVRKRPDWHITAIGYDSQGQAIKDGFFTVKKLTLKNIEQGLKDAF